MYDLNVLSQARLPIDDLVDRVRDAGMQSQFESTLYPDFKSIPFKLVDEYEDLGIDHIKAIQKEANVYGYFYFLAKNDKAWHTAVSFDYFNFPLMYGKECILSKIRLMAETLQPRGSSFFDATCLYLLYFYALLVNPRRNWITMDYLANGNKYHQLGTRLNGEMYTFDKSIFTTAQECNKTPYIHHATAENTV